MGFLILPQSRWQVFRYSCLLQPQSSYSSSSSLSRLRAGTDPDRTVPRNPRLRIEWMGFLSGKAYLKRFLTRGFNGVGGHSWELGPVPIPNTEVNLPGDPCGSVVRDPTRSLDRCQPHLKILEICFIEIFYLQSYD